MNERHLKSDLYCPYCLVPLMQVKAIGHLFCNHSLINCDYEVSPNAKAPLTFKQCQGALKLRYLQQAKSLESKIRRFNKDLVALHRKIKTLNEVPA